MWEHLTDVIEKLLFSHFTSFNLLSLIEETENVWTLRLYVGDTWSSQLNETSLQLIKQAECDVTHDTVCPGMLSMWLPPAVLPGNSELGY